MMRIMTEKELAIPGGGAASLAVELARPATATEQALVSEIVGPENLFEQCSPDQLSAAALLCGIHPVTPMFRDTLRDMSRMHSDITVGEIARIYLNARLNCIEDAARANAATIDRATARRRA